MSLPSWYSEKDEPVRAELNNKGLAPPSLQSIVASVKFKKLLVVPETSYSSQPFVPK